MAAILHRAIREKALRDRILDATLRNPDGDDFGGGIRIPKGWVELSRPLEYPQDRRGLAIEGDSIEGTSLIWASDTEDFAFDATATQNCTLRNFRLRVDTACAGMVRLTDNGAGGTNVRSSGFHAERIFVDCNALLEDVIHIERTPDGAKNDHHNFVEVQAQDYTGCFARIEGQAAVNVNFVRCLAQGREHGQYGIYNAADDFTLNGGQIQVIGGIWMEHQVADFYTENRLGKFVIDSVFSEQSKMLLYVPPAPDGNSSVAVGTADIRGLRYSTNTTQGPEDDVFIRVNAGILKIDGGTAGLTSRDDVYLIEYSVSDADKRLGWTIRNFMFCGGAPDTSHWQTGDPPVECVNVGRYRGSDDLIVSLEYRQPIVGENLADFEDNTDQDSYTTGSYSPKANRLLVATVIQTGTACNGPVADPDANGLTWVEMSRSSTSTTCMVQYRTQTGVGAPESEGMQVDFDSGDGTTGTQIIIDSFEGCNLSGTDGSAAVRNPDADSASAATSALLTLAEFKHAGDAHYYVITHAADEATTVADGFTELADSNHASPARGAASGYLAGSVTAEPSWATSATSRWCHAELVAAPK